MEYSSPSLTLITTTLGGADPICYGYLEPSVPFSSSAKTRLSASLNLREEINEPEYLQKH